MKKAAKEDRRHSNPGRPRVKVKKKPFQVMLDPRYIAHFKKVAESRNLTSQDLARLAMTALVPDPYSLEVAPEARRGSSKSKA